MEGIHKTKNKKIYTSWLQIIGACGGVVWIVTPSLVLANGALPYCMGAKMCQMGGAGVAIPLDSTSGNVNPALMAKVGRDLALQPILVFQNEKVDTSHAQLTAGTPLPPQTGRQTNRIKTYAAGYSGINYDINPQWSFGISTSGGGNNARYKRSIVSPALSAPRKLESMAALISQILAYKPSCDQAYGLGLILGYFQIKNNLTQFPSGIVTKGAGRTDRALGIGARVGGQWEVSSLLSLGAAVSSPVFFQKLKKYDDVIKRRPQLPPILTGGLALHMTKATDLLFDLEGNFWHTSPSFGKRPPIGQSWKNVLVLKTGIQHKLNEKFKLRAGYNFGRSPIPKNEVLFNALSEVITVAEHVASAGFSYNITETTIFDLGGAYMFPNKITDNGNGIAGSAAKRIAVKARAFVLTLGCNISY